MGSEGCIYLRLDQYVAEVFTLLFEVREVSVTGSGEPATVMISSHWFF